MAPTYRATARIAAPPQRAFDRLDDQEKLAAHMTNSSAMMGGGRMTYEFDAQAGRAVGSHIRMGGSAFGVRLFVDEVVTVREPPWHKAWATTGDVRLLVLSGYRIGFDVEPAGPGSDLTVWIDYDLSEIHWSDLPLPALRPLVRGSNDGGRSRRAA